MILSSIIYIEKNDKYLMLHRTRKVNDVNKDKWIGVGGKFEEGESPEECARREVMEETGLTLLNLFYRGIVTFTSNNASAEQMHLFKSTSFTGELKKCDEGELDWIGKKELLSLPIWEGDKIFLRLLDTDEKFFSLKLTYQESTLVSAVLNEQPLKSDG